MAINPQTPINTGFEVTVTNGGSGGTAQTDAATFTRGTTQETPVAGVVESSSPTLTPGGSGALSIDTSGNLRVNVVTGGGGGSQDGSTFTRGTTTDVPIAGVVEAGVPTLTAGKSGAFSLTTSGELRTVVDNGLQPAVTAYSGAITSLVLVNGAACTLYGLDAYSPSANSGDVWLQVFDAATTGAVTLGTTPPTFSFGIYAAGGGFAESWAAGRAFTNGIVVAGTTTRAGSTTVSNALGINVALT